MTRTSTSDPDAPAEGLRARILAAAAELLAAGGAEAATTRAVANAAAVQPPTIYRLFGDKSGLLDAVAVDVLAAYVAHKAARAPHADALEDLRAGWDMHVAFGLAHPAVFAILSAPRGDRPASPASAAGEQILRARIHRLAEIGRLRVSMFVERSSEFCARRSLSGNAVKAVRRGRPATCLPAMLRSPGHQTG
ncbi:TetR/AcrR family transcriptional regulator [Haliangium ochraceum]|uniref:TetR/AcrR family transcriptional regulator n=1 Tax=Haliangium ochraceum TaxID=80816 RepID=UPI0002FA14A4|nr:TetR/AcrR family transcriptional regulator [Haliangium ochraceum]